MKVSKLRLAKASLLSLMFAIVSTSSFAQLNFNKDTLSEKLKQWVPNVNDTTPGYVVGIASGEEILYTTAFGLADLELKVPMSVNNVFNVGSVSKQFAAFAILLLQEQGKLNVSDRVSKYLPEYEIFQNHNIRISNLVHHTSGLREIFELQELTYGTNKIGVTMDNLDFILRKQRRLNFAPGTMYQYINTNYHFLALIVEKVSGASYPDFIRTNIFLPLNMYTASIPYVYNNVLQDRAEGYIKDGNQFYKGTPWDGFYGPSGIFCAITDLLKWGSNFMTKKVGNSAVHEKIVSKGMYRINIPINYGFGLFIDKYKGITTIDHPGTRVGYAAHFLHLPEYNLTVAIQANTRSFPVIDVYRKIVDYLLAGKFPAIQPSTATTPFQADTINMSAEELSVYSGIYLNEVSDIIRKVYLENGALTYQRTPANESALVPISNNVFLIKQGSALTNNKVLFAKKPGTQKWIFTFAPERGDTTYFTQQDTTQTKGFLLKEYNGHYYNDETDASFEMRSTNDELVLIIRGWEPILLLKGFKDYYYNTDYIGSFKFRRDKKGNVSGFTYNSARTRFLNFKKIH
jgi:CubicO group peptidase (beta-lactamase class C family)